MMTCNIPKGKVMVPFVGDIQITYYDSMYHIDSEGKETRVVLKVSPNFSLVDNYEFEDTLIYKDYQKGQSKINFRFWGRDTKKLYTFLLKDFEKLLLLMEGGKITGRFTFRNQSGYIGCTLIEKITYIDTGLIVDYCSNCKAQFTMREDVVDGKVHCPYCGALTELTSGRC